MGQPLISWDGGADGEDPDDLDDVAEEDRLEVLVHGVLVVGVLRDLARQQFSILKVKIAQAIFNLKIRDCLYFTMISES